MASLSNRERKRWNRRKRGNTNFKSSSSTVLERLIVSLVSKLSMRSSRPRMETVLTKDEQKNLRWVEK